MTELWWGTRQNPSLRLMADIASVKMVFNPKAYTVFNRKVNWDTDFVISTTSIELLTDTEQPKWVVKFRMMKVALLPSDLEFNDEVILTMQYQEDRLAPPITDYVYPDVSKSPHNTGGHNLDIQNSSWDPVKSTPGTIAIQSVQWLRAWMYWSKYNEWPSAL